MMKTSMTIILWMFLCSLTVSQTILYNFSFVLEPYESLSNAEVLSLQGYTPSLSQFYKTVPLGFNFNIDNTQVDSVNIFISSPSLAWNTPKDCHSGSNALTSIIAFNCRRRSDTLSTTEVRYKTEGVAPKRIFKLEYFQLGFKDTNGHINAQIWLYEGSDSIQIRIGQLILPNIPTLYLTGLNGPLIGLQSAYRFVFDSDDADYAHFVNGTPDLPGSAEIFCPSSPVGIGIWYQTMDEAPKFGSVFTFYPNITNGIETQPQNLKLGLYPNPTEGTIQISGIQFDGDTQTLELSNTMGIPLKKIQVSKEHQIINTKDLPPGIYYLSGSNEHHHFTGKFLKM